TTPNGAGGPWNTTAFAPGSSSEMNSAQPRMNPSRPESGTNSPNGTRWILSYLSTIPRSVNRNTELVSLGGVVSLTSIEPTRSGALTVLDRAIRVLRRRESPRSAAGVAVSGHTTRSGCSALASAVFTATTTNDTAWTPPSSAIWMTGNLRYCE